MSDRTSMMQLILQKFMVFGKPVATYMKEYRIKQARELLTHGDSSIAEIAFEVGYENQSKFTQAFKDATGVLPRDYRKKYSADEILRDR